MTHSRALGQILPASEAEHLLGEQELGQADDCVRGATIIPRKGSIFPRIHGLESCRKWQRMFFYVKNRGDEDLLNLPPFRLAPPNEQHDWGFEPVETNLEINENHKFIEELNIPSGPQTTSCAPSSAAELAHFKLGFTRSAT